jgi:DNA processing protein
MLCPQSRSGSFPASENFSISEPDCGGNAFGNRRCRQGAKLVTRGADVIGELPTPVRAALVQAGRPETKPRNLLVAASLNWSEKKIYDLLNSVEAVHIDDIVVRSGLNSSEVLATLFDLEMKGIVRQIIGKQFNKVLR